MKNNFKLVTLCIFFILFFVSTIFSQQIKMQTGAERTAFYLPSLKGKNIGLVVNQTSMIGSVHLVD